MFNVVSLKQLFVRPSAEPETIGVTGQRLYFFLTDVKRGAGLGYCRWAGPGRLFSRGDFQNLLAELLRKGFIEWVDPEKHVRGMLVTASGWRWIDRQLELLK